MPNVFITGFERSGTTLLRRLVSMWPGYEKDVVHEQRKLLTYKTRQEAENNYNDQYSSIKSGEKIPYYGNSDFILNYIERFHDFWPEGLIFHIVRNPIKVAESCLRTFKRPMQTTAQTYAVNVQAVLNWLLDEPNTFTIQYEMLIEKPKEYIKLIYDKLGDIPDDTVIDKILSTREVWELNGKRMCGLRYSDRVGRINHNGL